MLFIPLWYLKRPKNFGRSVCLFWVRFCRERGRERVYRVREGESESGGEVRDAAEHGYCISLKGTLLWMYAHRSGFHVYHDSQSICFSVA